MVHLRLGLKRDEWGITGLETAIILIAFVVVASVFAYTVLSAGIFSADKSEQVVNSSLQSVSISLKIVGPIIAKVTDNGDNIDEIVFVMVINLDGDGINLTVPPNNTTVVALHTASQTSDDLSGSRRPSARMMATLRWRRAS